MQARNRLRARGRGEATSPRPPALTAKCAPGRGGRRPLAATLAGAARSVNEDFLPFDSVAPHFFPLSCLVAVQPREFGSWAKWSPAVFPSLASASALEMWPGGGADGGDPEDPAVPSQWVRPLPRPPAADGVRGLPNAGGLGQTPTLTGLGALTHAVLSAWNTFPTPSPLGQLRFILEDVSLSSLCPQPPPHWRCPRDSQQDPAFTRPSSYDTDFCLPGGLGEEDIYPNLGALPGASAQ